jgi:hypothetical protein
MKQLTKEERKEIYLRLSEKTNEPIHDDYFTCWKLYEEIGGSLNEQGDFPTNKVLSNFPEFKKACMEYDYFDRTTFLEDGDRKPALLRAAELCD